MQKVIREYYLKKWEAEGKPSQLANAANGLFALDMSDLGLRNIVEEYLNKQQASEKLSMKGLDRLVLSGSIGESLFGLKEIRREKTEEKAGKEPAAMKSGNEKGIAETAALIDPSDYEFQRMMMEYLNKKKTGQGPLDFRVEIATRWELSD